MELEECQECGEPLEVGVDGSLCEDCQNAVGTRYLHELPDHLDLGDDDEDQDEDDDLWSEEHDDDF